MASTGWLLPIRPRLPTVERSSTFGDDAVGGAHSSSEGDRGDVTVEYASTGPPFRLACCENDPSPANDSQARDHREHVDTCVGFERGPVDKGALRSDEPGSG